MRGLGDEFRAAREARHLSLSDVSEQIHIRSVYLESIEHDDASFAAPVYVRGFIRTYARYLGMDTEAVVAQFNATHGSAHGKSHEPVPVAPLPTRRRPSPWLWIAGVAAAVLLVFVGYKYFDLQQSGGSSQTVAVASPAPSAAAAGTTPSAPPAHKATPASARMLRVRVTADSWASIKIDGATVFEGIAKAGSSKDFHGKNATVRAGNAGGIDLVLNGKELGKMGNSGSVVERTLTLASE